ncbi:MAG: terminase large subunit [Alphaproteobacteria bacterium]|nr:terminase large subunit [Alphaproteobacteria bacterium]
MTELDDFAQFCSQLTLDNGRPMMLEGFQRELLAGYFDGARETLVIQPKKSGKTTTIAALATYHCLFETNAECVVAAASRDQAGILLRQAKGFIDRSEKLAKYLHVKDREILTKDKRSRIRILAADADTADGVLPTLAIVDELHRAKSADLYGIFRDGLGPRGGQMITISTAGESEGSVLGEMRAAARRLDTLRRDGKHLSATSDNGQFVYHEWALDRDDDVEDLKLVKLANPASWQTEDELRRRRDSPSMLPWQWARFACGIWVGAEGFWIHGEDWAALETAERIQPGERVTIGFDGSRTSDATAIVICRVDDGLLEVGRVWEHPPGAKDWEVPVGEVDATLAKIMERFRVVRGYFDPPLWQTELDEWAREFGGEQVVRFYTSRSRMMAAVERFRTDVTAGKLKHAGDPILTRHVLNAQTKEGRGGYWLTKPGATGADKIDAAVAAVLAYEARADALATVRPKNRAVFIG